MPSAASDWLSLNVFSAHVIFLECRSQGGDSIFMSVHAVFYTILAPGKVMGFLLQWHYTCSGRKVALGLLILLEFVILLCVQNLRSNFFQSLLKHFWGFTTRTEKARRPRWGIKGTETVFALGFFSPKEH